MNIYEFAFYGIANLEELKNKFVSTLKNGRDSKHLEFYRLLLEILFEIRADCLSIMDGRAYVFTSLYLSAPHTEFEIIQNWMIKNRILIIALGYRDRATFDEFRTKPYTEELGILEDEKQIISAYYSKFRGNKRVTASAMTKWHTQIELKLYEKLKKLYLSWKAQQRNRELASVPDEQKDSCCYICEFDMSHYSKTQREAHSFSHTNPIIGVIGGDKSAITDPVLLCTYCITSLRLSELSPEMLKKQQIQSRLYNNIKKSF